MGNTNIECSPFFLDLELWSNHQRAQIPVVEYSRLSAACQSVKHATCCVKNHDTSVQVLRTACPRKDGQCLFFLLLALVNTLAFGGAAVVSAPAPCWPLLLIEGFACRVGVVGLTWTFCRSVDPSSIRELGLQRRDWLPKTSGYPHLYWAGTRRLIRGRVLVRSYRPMLLPVHSRLCGALYTPPEVFSIIGPCVPVH